MPVASLRLLLVLPAVLLLLSVLLILGWVAALTPVTAVVTLVTHFDDM
jgi:hypothetical protein